MAEETTIARVLSNGNRVWTIKLEVTVVSDPPGVGPYIYVKNDSGYITNQDGLYAVVCDQEGYPFLTPISTENKLLRG